MSGDEDWFERALRESNTGASDSEDSEASSDGDDSEASSDGGDSEDAADVSPGATTATDADGTFEDLSEDNGSLGAGDTEGPLNDDIPSGDASDAFDDDIPSGDASDADPFGEAAGEDLFEDDFASAFGGGEADFADDDFDSAIPRVDIGVEGLDDMILGGVPERHLLVCIGGPGSGKTTFGLQFLHHGLQNGENGVFITLEQSYEGIMDTANGRGWEFDRYEQEDALAVVDLDPVEMANSLDNIRGELPELVMEFDADRLVLDSVSLLEMMYTDEARRRTEVFDFTRSLKQAGVTTFLTSEASRDNEYASRHGIIEYLTDAVFFLQYIRGQSQETRLAVEIQKIRNANHSRERKPYEITAEGISVYQQANIF